MWDPEPIRNGLRTFIAKRKLKILPWAKRAGVSEGSLRNFLSCTTDSMNLETLGKLADAEHVSIAELIGQLPEPQQQGLSGTAVLDVRRLYEVVKVVVEVAARDQQDISPDLVAKTVLDVYAQGGAVTRTPVFDNVIYMTTREPARG
jgi:hypothetical protein